MALSADPASVVLFADGRGGAAFLLWLCLGSGAIFSVVLCICAVVAWSMGRSRELRIDGGGAW